MFQKEKDSLEVFVEEDITPNILTLDKRNSLSNETLNNGD